MTAHKILISTAVVFFLFFTFWEFRNYSNSGEAWAVLRAVLYALTSIGFAVYLKNLKRWYK
jgi:drug/metabolite transporter (DMT)-like permease